MRHGDRGAERVLGSPPPASEASGGEGSGVGGAFIGYVATIELRAAQTLERRLIDLMPTLRLLIQLAEARVWHYRKPIERIRDKE
jgi:hypothetical protein